MQALASSFGSQGAGSTQQTSAVQPSAAANAITITSTSSSNITTIANCNNVTAQGICTSCISGYTLTGNSCVISSVQTSNQTIQTIPINQSNTSSSSGNQTLAQLTIQTTTQTITPVNITNASITSSTNSTQSNTTSVSGNQSDFVFARALPTDQTVLPSPPQIMYPVQTPATSVNVSNVTTSVYSITPQSSQQLPPNIQPLITQPTPLTPVILPQPSTVQTTTQSPTSPYTPPAQSQPSTTQTTVIQSQQIPIIITPQQPSNLPDPYCAAFNPDGTCSRCAQRYYFGSNRVCTPVSGNCNGYNPTTGACTSCYQSFLLYNG